MDTFGLIPSQTALGKSCSLPKKGRTGRYTTPTIRAIVHKETKYQSFFQVFCKTKNKLKKSFDFLAVIFRLYCEWFRAKIE